MRFDLAIRWIAVGVATAVLAGLLSLVHLPSASLFAALVVGAVVALSSDAPLEMPPWGFIAGQAGIGVILGCLIEASALRDLGDQWFPVVCVIAGTLVVSVLGGLLFSRLTRVDRVTGLFSLIAGGAAGSTIASGELGGDHRLVGVLQYLRVALFVALAPLVTAIVFDPVPVGLARPAPVEAADGPGWGIGLLFTLGCALGGMTLGRVARLPAPAMLGPIVFTGVLVVTGVSGGASVPAPLVHLSYALIGLQIGLGFTRATLSVLGRLLPLAIALMLAMAVVCAGFGWLLAEWTGVDHLTGYLATTPGAVYAVLATAVDAGADATFTLAVQIVRMLAMLLVAPFVVRWLSRRQQD